MNSPDQREIMRALSRHSRARNFELFTEGESVNTVIFGEEHYKYTRLHAAWIRFAKPNKVLLEQLGGFQYNPTTSDLSVQPGRLVTSAKEVEIVGTILASKPEVDKSGIWPITQACAEVGSLMIGCDLTPSEMAKWMKDKGYDIDNRTHFNGLSRHRDDFIYGFLAEHQGSALSRSLAVMGDIHASWLYYTNLVKKGITNYAYLSHVAEDLR